LPFTVQEGENPFACAGGKKRTVVGFLWYFLSPREKVVRKGKGREEENDIYSETKEEKGKTRPKPFVYISIPQEKGKVKERRGMGTTKQHRIICPERRKTRE